MGFFFQRNNITQIYSWILGVSNDGNDTRNDWNIKELRRKETVDFTYPNRFQFEIITLKTETIITKDK